SVVGQLPREGCGVIPYPCTAVAQACIRSCLAVGPAAHPSLGDVPGEPIRFSLPPVVCENFVMEVIVRLVEFRVLTRGSEGDNVDFAQINHIQLPRSVTASV